MAGTTKRSTKEAQWTASPQMWALNPIVSMVGMAGWGEITKESVTFVSERMAKNMQAQRDFLACKSFEEFLQLQSDFFQDNLNAYMRQFERVGELVSEVTALGWSEATTRRAREYDDIPL